MQIKDNTTPVQTETLAPTSPIAFSENRTYSSVVKSWALERELLGNVQAYTARKAAQKALLFAPWIGSDDVAEIEPASITKALIELGATGGRMRKGLEAGTLRAAHLAGTQALNWAVANGLSTSNPFDRVAKPKARRKTRRFLTSTQAASFNAEVTRQVRACMEADDVRQASFRLAVCIALATGMRRGEIFALEWDDFDLEHLRVNVMRAVKGDGSIGEPKSASGVRSVAIGSNLARLLAEVHAWHERVLPERRWPQPECVICNGTGARASMNTFENWWRAWALENGWKGLRFHDLRHSHATILISSGADVKTVQMRLGHSSADITLSIYAHAVPLSDSAAAASMDEALFRE